MSRFTFRQLGDISKQCEIRLIGQKGFAVRTCELTGCDGKHYRRGLCQKHYLRKWRTGDVNTCKTANGEYWRKRKAIRKGQKRLEVAL